MDEDKKERLITQKLNQISGIFLIASNIIFFLPVTIVALRSSDPMGFASFVTLIFLLPELFLITGIAVQFERLRSSSFLLFMNLIGAFIHIWCIAAFGLYSFPVFF